MKIISCINQYTPHKLNFCSSSSIISNKSADQQAQKYIDDADSDIEFTLRRAKNFFDSLEPQAVSSKIDTIRSRAQELFDSQDPQRETCILSYPIESVLSCPFCEGNKPIFIEYEDYYFQDSRLTSYNSPDFGRLTRDRIKFSKDDSKTYTYINELNLSRYEFDEDTKDVKGTHETYSCEFQDGKLKKVIAPNKFSQHPLTITYDENGKISHYQNKSKKGEENITTDIYYKDGLPYKIIAETESRSNPKETTKVVYSRQNGKWVSTKKN